MGIKSTYEIERGVAINVILSKIHTCTNGELAEMLECLPESRYRNYRVFEGGPPISYSQEIKDVREFNNTEI